MISRTGASLGEILRGVVESVKSWYTVWGKEREPEMNTVWLVIPCYNEEAVLPETSRRLSKIMHGLIEKKKIDRESRVAFVNDGSRDRTWELIRNFCEQDPLFAGINLSRNRGHQNALLAGLMTAKQYADAVISMDADLQDDVNVIERFIEKYLEGADIVYGVRSSRKTDTFFKKFTAESFYKLMKFMGVDIVFNHADCRLMSRRALEGLEEFQEVNLFLRGIVPQIGYPTAIVEYERNARFAGESKYPLKKMLSFAFDGITSFSIRPLRFSFVLGSVSCIVSLFMLCYCVVNYFLGNTISGWASLGVSIWALGGLQLLMLGIIGEYVGKCYLETKHRPRYFIEQILLDGENSRAADEECGRREAQ